MVAIRSPGRMTPELFLRRFENHGRKHNPMESQFAIGIPIIHEWIRLRSQPTVSQEDLDRLLAKFAQDPDGNQIADADLYMHAGSQIGDLYSHVWSWGRELGLSVPRDNPWYTSYQRFLNSIDPSSRRPAHDPE